MSSTIRGLDVTALARSRRNPKIPSAYFPQHAQQARGSDVDDLRREYRKQFLGTARARDKEMFLEKARNSPDHLYDELTRAKSSVDLNAPISGAATNNAHHLEALKEIVQSGPGPGAPPQPGQGEMWWGETHVELPSRIGMYWTWSDIGMLLFGTLHWDSGDLFQSGLHIYNSFYLSPDRMPAENRVRSSPGGVLSGQIFGYTGGAASFFLGGMFEGDLWSKCFLRLHQRAFAINVGNPVDTIPAAPPASVEFPIVNVDGSNDFAEGNLPGGLAYPSIEINLIKERVLRIDLEVDIFFQLEGESGIRFGGPGHGNPALYQGAQWKLQPA
jgi:hypothetical protein